MNIDIIPFIGLLAALLGFFIGLITLGYYALDRLGTRIGGRIDEVKTDLVGRIDKAETNLVQRISEVKTDLTVTRQELGGRIDKVKTDLGERIEKVETNLAETRKELKADIASTRKELKADINKLDGRFHGLFQSHDETRKRVGEMSECLIRMEDKRLVLIDLKLDKLTEQVAASQSETEQPEAEPSTV